MWITHDQASPKHQRIWIMTRTTQISYPQLCVYPGFRFAGIHLHPHLSPSAANQSVNHAVYGLTTSFHILDTLRPRETKTAKLRQMDNWVKTKGSIYYMISITAQDDRPHPLQNFSATSADPKKSSTSIQTNTRERCLVVGCGPKWK